MPAGRTHRDVTAIDVAPQGEARALPQRFQFPSHVAAAPLKLEHHGCVGARHGGIGDVGRTSAHRRERHVGSDDTQAAVGVERRPLAELDRVGECLPDLLRRLAQRSNENERPGVAVLLADLGAVRAARRVRIGHDLFLFFAFVRADLSIRSRWRSRASTCADQNWRKGVSQSSSSRNGSGRRR